MGQFSIDQFVPMLHAHDAVGNHTLRLQDALRSNGYDSEIFVEHFDNDTVDKTKLYSDFEDVRKNAGLIIYQFATSSDMVAWLLQSQYRVWVNFHNITPPEYFDSWNRVVAKIQRRAQIELRQLASIAEMGLTVSRFNESVLNQFGFRECRVLPPLVGSSSMERKSGGKIESNYYPLKWLSVGRLSPNKSLEDAIGALFYFNEMTGLGAELTIVGKNSISPYLNALRVLVRNLGLQDKVVFVGSIGDNELSNLYCTSDLLVVSSRHEGYCFPLVEAMSHGLPIVGVAEGAIPEVLGSNHNTVEAHDPKKLAAKIIEISERAEWKSVIESNYERLSQLNLDSAGAQYIKLIDDTLRK